MQKVKYMEKSKRRSIAIRTKNGCLVVLSFKENEQKDWKKNLLWHLTNCYEDRLKQ